MHIPKIRVAETLRSPMVTKGHAASTTARVRSQRTATSLLQMLVGTRLASCYASAITSISTATSFGRRATSTVERAGGAFLQIFP